MNFLSKSISALSALFAVKKSLTNPSVWLRGDETDTGQGAKLLSPYSQSAWVYIAVSVLAENVAQIPFRISRVPASAKRDLHHSTTPQLHHSIRSRALGENIIESGPVVELFEHPHPTMDRALFWETVMTWRCLRGESFILPLDAQDQPVDLSALRHSSTPTLQHSPVRRLITLAPDQFWHIVQDYELLGWRFTGAPFMSPIHSQVLLPSEVIHSRSPNPYLYWRGMSPLLVAMLPAAADYAAEQFMKGLMTNNADTGLIVSTDQQVSPEQREAILAALRERKRKAGTADRPLFLWAGAKVDKPPVTSADLQFLENRKMNRQEIAAVFKVPESMMGFTESKAQLGGGGGSTVEAEKLSFIQNALTPHCRRIEAAVAPIIKSFDPALYGWFDIEGLPIMQEARRLRLDSAVKAFGLAVPFNEINAVYDLGFRAMPWGNKAYLPMNLKEVGSAPAADETPPGNDANQAAANPFARLLDLLTEEHKDNKP